MDLTIEGAISSYLEGAHFADRSKLDLVFHPEFRTTGIFEGSEVWLNKSDILDSLKPSEGALPDWSMSAPIVFGDTCHVTVRSGWQGRDFVELVTLLRGETGWQIVFKTFHIDATS